MPFQCLIGQQFESNSAQSGFRSYRKRQNKLIGVILDPAFSMNGSYIFKAYSLPLKHFSTTSLDRPTASKIWAHLYDCIVEIPIFAMTLEIPRSIAAA